MKGLKLERRARQKAAKKEKRKGRAVQAAGTGSTAGNAEDHAAEGSNASSLRDLTRKVEACDGISEEPEPKRPKLDDEKRVPFKARVVVDLGFDNMMSDKVPFYLMFCTQYSHLILTDHPIVVCAFSVANRTLQEIVSLCSQLHHTYAANRRAVRPFASLLFTSLDGRTYTRLESLADASYRRWSNTEWWKDSYERLWIHPGETADLESDKNEWTPVQNCDKDKVVYLTADSGEELTELREDEVYIVGGICDHNRYKVALSFPLTRFVLRSSSPLSRC